MDYKFENVYRLTPLQEGLLFHTLTDESRSTYMEQFTFRLSGRLGVNAFNKALKQIFARHEILRTAIIYEGTSQPVQVVVRDRYIEVDYHDWTNVNHETHSARLAIFRQKDRETPFDLVRTPLMRATLIQTDADSFQFIWTWHHLLLDGWCMRILATELLAVYNGIVSGNTPKLPPVTPYSEFIKWLGKRDANREEHYWRNYMAGYERRTLLPGSALDTRFGTEYQKQNYDFAFDEQTTAKLSGLASENRVTLNTLVKGLWAIMLAKYNDSSDVLFGEIVSGRPTEIRDVETMIGLFINCIPIRIRLDHEEPVTALIRRAQTESVASLPYHHFPLAEIQRISGNRSPLLDHLVSFQNYPEEYVPDGTLAENISILGLDVFDQTSFDFEISFFPGRELGLKVGYNARLFEAVQIETIIRHFSNIVKQFVTHHSIKVGALSLMNADETARAMEVLTGPNVEVDYSKPLYSYVDAFALKSPETVAIRNGKSITTYAALKSFYDQLAGFLIERRIQSNEIIVVLMDRSPELIGTILSIWKAGGCYMPVLPTNPIEHTLSVIRSAKAKMLVTTSKYAGYGERVMWESGCVQSVSIIDEADDFGNIREHAENQKRFWEAVGTEASDDITAGGWYSSFTGMPLSRQEMDEYSKNVLRKVTPLVNRTSSVLEIGVGSGLTMFNIAPLVAKYVAIDQSEVVIERNQKKIDRRGLDGITQKCLFATELSALEKESYDLIVLNSVIQDFPGYDYLRKVLDDCMDLLAPGGSIFIGDVMDLSRKDQLIKDLHQYASSNKTGDQHTKLNWSSELFVPVEFFEDFQNIYASVSQFAVSQKIHTIKNELTEYRYDVLISKNTSNNARIEHVAQKRVYSVQDIQKPVNYQAEVQFDPDCLAYVIFTSGSTGQPKGAMVSHRGLLNHKHALVDFLNISPGKVVAQTAVQSFDISVWQMVTALMAGGTVAIFENEVIEDITTFLDRVRSYETCIIQVVPSYLALIVETLESDRENAYRQAFDSVDKVLVTGEEVFPDLIQRWYDLFPSKKLINAYGPAETSDDVTLGVINHHINAGHVAIGRPIQNSGVYIVDQSFNLCPPGVQGEICVAGVPVGHGYINEAALTREKFVRNPFTGEGLIYLTGDLGMYHSDGTLVFVGRKDHQVKIRGYRIELGDVEAYISGVPGVSKSCAVMRDQLVSENRAIHAFIELAAGATITLKSVKESLASRMPHYMQPAQIVIVDRLPMLPNGKINRKFLTEHGPEVATKSEFEPPQTDIEKKVSEAWKEVLSVKEVGRNDNFFELGGHSLKAIRLASRIHKTMDVKVNLREIFFCPVLKDFSIQVGKAQLAKHHGIPVLPRSDLYRVSHAQRRLWVLSQFEATSVAYNECSGYDLLGSLDQSAFERAVNTLVERHEILRTTFVTQDKEVFQIIHDLADFNFRTGFINLSNEVKPVEEAQKIMYRSVHQHFDLAVGPLFRVTLMKISDNRHVVLTNMHHIINDGWSDSVLMRDMLALYESTSRHQPAQLPPLTIHYKDFAAWQNAELEGDRLQVHKSYWLDKLAGELTALDLPSSKERPATITYNGKEERFRLSAEICRRLNDFCSDQGISLFSSLVAILNVLFYKYSGEKDILLGTYCGSRDHSDLENQIGFYINTLVLRNEIDPEVNFQSFAQSVSTTVLEALEHRVYPFDVLVDQLKIKRDLSRAPLFDVLVGLQNFAGAAVLPDNIDSVASGLIVAEFKVEKLTSIYDLNFMFSEDADELSLNIRYNTDVFADNDITRLFNHFCQSVQWLLDHSSQKLALMEYLTEAEKEELLGFQQQSETQEASLLTRVGLHAQHNADAIALIHNESSFSYQELYQLARRNGEFLESIDANRKVVAVLMDRSLSWVGSILGAWAANAVYMPLNPEDPMERLLTILNDSRASVLLFQSGYAELANALQWRAEGLHNIACVDGDAYSMEQLEKKTAVLKEMWEFVGEQAADDIAGGGWLNSYTGKPFSREEMDEYVTNTVARISPFITDKSKVLEIGCASGLTMFAIAPLVKEYVGTDLSEVIIQKNRETIRRQGWTNIRQHCVPADAIDQIGEEGFDVIILNSVVQNFVGYNYFRHTLAKCIASLSDRGVIFLGDLMDEKKREALTGSMLEYQKQHPSANSKTDWSTEFFVNRDFLDNLKSQVSEITEVVHLEKLRTIENELTEFRYDSLLLIDKNKPVAGIRHRYNQFGSQHFSNKHFQVRTHDIAADNAGAYIIYTSGSTGRPKGAIVTHHGMMNHLFAKADILRAKEGCVVAQTSVVTFDISLWQFSLALAVNGSTVIVDKEVFLDTDRFMGVIREKGIEIFEVVPSYLQIMLQHFERAGRNINPGELRMLVSCGEVLTPDLVNRWLAIFPKIPVVNAYGPTEASCDITHQLILSPVEASRVTVGKPVPNLRVRIVNEEMQLCPVLVKGQIVVSGAGVGLGYINDVKRTSEMFVEDTLDGQGTMYKTGDIGRYLPNGEIDFFGRKDNQVKVRGVRIELGELETALARLDGVDECAVIVVESEIKQLHAFISSDRLAETALPALRRELGQQLPDYMVPDKFFLLKNLPHLSNGKIDRKKLPDLVSSKVQVTTGRPMNDMENRLFELWAQILGHNNFDVNQSFFEVGGHSLKAMRLIGEIGESFGIDVAFRDLYVNSSIKGMASLIFRSKENTYKFIEPVGHREYYEPSHSQKRLWVLNQFGNVASAYNEFSAYRLTGDLDTVLIKKALTSLVARHEILRTTIVPINEEPMQRIARPEDFELDFEYLIDDACDVDDEAVKEREEAFDLEKGPLFRVKIIRRQGDHYIFVTMHHIITDGWSAIIFMRDFFALYDVHKNLAEMPAPLKIQYKDYAAWKNAHLQGAFRQEAISHWSEVLSGELPRLEIPAAAGRGNVQTYEGTSLSFELPSETVRAVEQLKARYECSGFVVLNGIVNLLLHKITGQYDLITGTVTAGREHADIHDLIGFFVNTIPIRVGINKEKTIDDFFYSVKDDIAKALSFSQYPFDLLLDDLRIERDLSRSPIFDVLIEYQGFADIFNWQSQSIQQGIDIETLNTGSGRSLFDLSFIFSGSSDRLVLEIEFNTDLYDARQVQDFADRFNVLVSGIVANSQKAVSELAIISEEEEHNILQACSGPVIGRDYQRTVDRRIDGIGVESPGMVALKYGNHLMTYGELYEKTNRLSHYLHAKGVGRDEVVAILMSRSIDFVVGMIGAWKANACYLPMDPGIPLARLIRMIEDAKVKFVLFSAECLDIVTELARECASPEGYLCVDRLQGDLLSFDQTTDDLHENDVRETDIEFAEELADFPVTYPAHRRVDPNALAYILFTSGSTGTPKGVMIEHAGMLNHKISISEILAIGEGTVVAQTASQLFDISVWQFITPLMHGGVTVIYPEAIILDIQKFLLQLNEDQVEVIEIVPSYLVLMLEELESVHYDLEFLCYLIITGETVPPVLIERWFNLFPQIPVINAYGPAEAGDDVSLHVMRELTADGIIPVGSPLANMRVYVLDDSGHLLPSGVRGEISVGGVGVGRGYVNFSENNSFSDDPFAQGRLYKTGDLGMYDGNGNLLFLGRQDGQVKVRGHRIELGEIEICVSKMAGIALSFVATQQHQTGATEIYAWIETIRGAVLTGADVRQWLSDRLPAYMVPSRIEIIPALPLLSNGKIDRQKLMSAIQKQETYKQHRLPVTETEQRLADIWQEVLGIEQIGLDDNFFELGGDSLKLVKIFRKVSKLYPAKLDLADYFMSKTISELADKLLTKGVRTFAGEGSGSLFYLQKELSALKTDLFVFPPAGGLSMFYRGLVNQLAPSFNCHLFNYRGVEPGEEPFTDLNDVVTYYSDIILKLAGSHPEIRLVGGSSGGNLIFELADYLEKTGHKCFVIMLDSEPTVIIESDENIRSYLDIVGGYVNDTDQGRMFMDRYEAALQGYMKIFNSEMQDVRKMICSDILNFICSDSGPEVKLWNRHTSGSVNVSTLPAGSHLTFLEFTENFAYICQEILAAVNERALVGEYSLENDGNDHSFG